MLNLMLIRRAWQSGWLTGRPSLLLWLISQRASTVAANRMYISQVAVLCARQGISLRGHDESSTSSNKGNYVEILELLTSVMPELGRKFRSLPKYTWYKMIY